MYPMDTVKRLWKRLYLQLSQRLRALASARPWVFGADEIRC